MRVERATLLEVALTLREPFRTAAGTVTSRRVVLLRLQGGAVEGWSECVALPGPTYTEETSASAWSMLTETILPAVVGHDWSTPEGVLEPVRWVRGHPMAMATAEMAAWDMLARSRGESLAKTLGGTQEVVSVGVVVGLQPSVDALFDVVERRLGEGYARIKVKIEPGRDVDVVAGVRERFPDLDLWVDGNSAYSLADADRLAELDAFGLGLIEQPLAHDDFLDHARLQARLRTPICLDESIRSERDVALALELGSCSVLNVKPGRVGGHAVCVRIHDRARAAGIPVWCGGMLESGVGRAHNLALASLPGFTLPGDISASSRYWERDLVKPEFVVEDGQMAVPTAPGIGVELDLDWIETNTTRSITVE